MVMNMVSLTLEVDLYIYIFRYCSKRNVYITEKGVSVVLSPYLALMGWEEEGGRGWNEWRDDIHKSPCFGSKH